MKTLLTTLFFCLCTLAGMAQDAFFTITQQALAHQTSIPVVSNRKARKAADRINRYIQLATLGTLLPEHTDSLSNPYTLTILEHNQRYLSIRCSPVNADSALRYPEKDIAFNAATGMVISLPDLFTINGLYDLRKIILRQHQSRVNQYTDGERRSELSRCLKDNLNRFTLDQGMLLIYSGPCFAPEQTEEAITSIPMQPIEHMLSQYGRALFGLDKKFKLKKVATNSFPDLYTGDIGTEKVLLQLDPDFDKHMTGTLYLTEQQKGIRLDGTFRSNHFEAEGDWGRLSVIISNGRIQGNYRANGGRPQPVTLRK